MQTQRSPWRATPEWKEIEYCPFCGAEIPDSETGLDDHLRMQIGCRDEFRAMANGLSDRAEATP